jgi:hypothetical protein
VCGVGAGDHDGISSAGVGVVGGGIDDTSRDAGQEETP